MAAFPDVSHCERHFVALSFLSVLLFAPVRSNLAQSTLPECSLSKTNTSCTLSIDRSNPVAPSTVQLYSDQQLTVIINNPLPFERYFLDFTTGQATIAPDVAANIVTGLTGNLGKLSNVVHSPYFDTAVRTAKVRSAPKKVLDGCYSKNFKETQWNVPNHVLNAKQDFVTCFGALAGYAMTTYHDLEPLVAPDALTSGSLTSRTLDYLTTQADIQRRIDIYLDAEDAISNSVTALAKPPGTPPPTYSTDEETFISDLGVYQKIIDSVSADLAGYEQRLKDLGPCGYTDPDAGGSKNTFCWDQAIAAYSRGNLAIWKDNFYLRTDAKTCTQGAAANLCAEPDKDLAVWKLVSVEEIKSLGDFDSTKTYQIGNQVSYSNAWWTCIGICTPFAQPKSPVWVDSAVAQGQSLPSVTIKSRADDKRIYEKMVTRTITYSLDTLNLVSYSQEAAATSTNKKALATIAINFADRSNKDWHGIPYGRPYTALRWEASAGVFFSSLPNRTFTLSAPSTGTGSSTQTVQDSTTRPTPVPFAAANYRITGDLAGRWKQNFYLTGAVGVNPNNTTAEFGVGPSYAWRTFMVSAFAHIGHDTRWSSMTPGSNGDLPTTSHWTVKAALGISVRIPSLTGR